MNSPNAFLGPTTPKEWIGINIITLCQIKFSYTWVTDILMTILWAIVFVFTRSWEASSGTYCTTVIDNVLSSTLHRVQPLGLLNGVHYELALSWNPGVAHFLPNKRYIYIYHIMIWYDIMIWYAIIIWYHVDTMQLNDPLILFASEGSALSISPFMCSPLSI